MSIAAGNGKGCLLAGHSSAPSPTSPRKNKTFVWDEDRLLAKNYGRLAKRLAEKGDLFRSPIYGGGLLQTMPGGNHRSITTGSDLAPIIVDRVPLRVVKDGKTKGRCISNTHLNTMLKAESFLRHFLPVDQITNEPLYLPDFALAKPGYNDGGQGYRILYAGEEPKVSDSLDTINRFLDVMDFGTNADRTNAVAAALTVVLRNHWPGGKPIVLATATKSHGGKDTIITFATGLAVSLSISYQSTNWAFARSFVGAVKSISDAAVVVVENARLDRRDRFIASAFLERMATDPHPFFFSTGTGTPVRIRNHIVLAISTNFGTVSEDILNRSLPIHLNPVGDVAERRSPIGNPRYEFLPANKQQIAAELRGMIERWKAAGQPLDDDVQHPFSLWARTIGGVLKVNGFTNFLGNYAMRKTADDPIRESLGLLGVARPNEWLRPGDWACLAVALGLTKSIIPDRDRENDVSRARAMGIILSAHEQETFMVEDDFGMHTLRLEKSRHRSTGEAKVQYRFVSGPGDMSATAPDDAPPLNESRPAVDVVALNDKDRQPVVGGSVQADTNEQLPEIFEEI